MLRTAAFVAAAASLVGNAAATCAEPFDATKDYFPAASQFQPAHAQTFSISYRRSYKVLSIPSANTFVTLRACGAPLVARSELGAANTDAVIQLELPLSRASVLSTTELPWLELLGERSAIKAIYGAELVNSPCVQQGVAATTIHDVKNPDWTTDVAAVTSLSDAAFCTAGWGCPGTAIDVPVADNAEHSVLAVAEYLGFFAAFFNLEDKANTLVHSIADRYSCQKSAVNALLAAARVDAHKPIVMWAYVYQGTWSVASCPNYYCEFVADAGGAMLMPRTSSGSGQYGGFLVNEIADMFARADVWIFTGDTWESDILPAMNIAGNTLYNATFNPALTAALASSPAVANRRVFDMRKSGTNAWFETRIAQPDAVLQDMVSAINPTVYTAPAPAGFSGALLPQHSRIWLRNVFTEAAGTAPAPQACTDAAAPMTLQSDVCPLWASQRQSSAGSGDDAVKPAAVIAGAVVAAVAVVALVVLGVVLHLKSAAVASAAVSSATAAKIASMSTATAANAPEVVIQNPMSIKAEAVQA